MVQRTKTILGLQHRHRQPSLGTNRTTELPRRLRHVPTNQIRHTLLKRHERHNVRYDAKTGDLLWNYTYKDPWSETLWSDYWSSLRPRIVSDGKIYLGQSEHSVNQPQPRGAPFVCLNATTGEVIWSIAGMFRQTDWGGSAVMGDSIIATMDTYNQMVYAIGKGPSATTVTAPDTGVQYGTSVTIKGTVTDISPGTKDEKIQMRFPNGVAAVSDDSMSDWMLYVYKQFTQPTNTTGVPVSINVVLIQTATTAQSEQPQVVQTASIVTLGPLTSQVHTKYTQSLPAQTDTTDHNAESAFTVEEAPTHRTHKPETALPPFEMYIIGLGVAIIVALAIATLLILKKKP